MKLWIAPKETGILAVLVRVTIVVGPSAMVADKRLGVGLRQPARHPGGARSHCRTIGNPDYPSTWAAPNETADKSP